MEEEDPLDEVSPSLQDYRDVNTVDEYDDGDYDDEDDIDVIDEEPEPEARAPNGGTGEDPPWPAADRVPAPDPATAQAVMEVAPETDGAVEAPAPGHSKGDPELLAIYKTAAARCDRKWPPPVQVRPDKGLVWQGMKKELPRAPEKHVLPFALGFRGVLTHTWDEPNASDSTGPRSAFPLDTEMPATAGLTGIPTIGRDMAGYLVNPFRPHYFPMGKPPTFLDDKNKKASMANKKLYGHLVTQAKSLNAGSLLQCSLSELLLSGDTLSVEQVVEARRLIDEIVQLNWSVTEATGRAMAASIIQERTRWLDVHPTTGLIRAMLLDRPICNTLDPDVPPEGLFQGGMKELIAKGEESRKNTEAMSQLQEPARPPPPPPLQSSRPDRDRSTRSNWRFRSERVRARTPAPERPPARSRGRSKPQKVDDHRDDPPPRGNSRRGRGRGRGRGK